MQFPILSLPNVAFLHCYEFLNYKEIILLSQCSKSTRNLIQSIEKHKKDTRMDVLVQATRMTMQMKCGKSSWKEFSWSLHTRRDAMVVYMNEFVDVKIEGYLWRMSPHETGFRILSRYNEDLFLYWIQFLKHLFGCKLSRVQFENLNHFNFDTFFCQPDILHETEAMIIWGVKLSDWELKFVMDNVHSKVLQFEGGVENTFLYDRPIRFPTFYSSAWYCSEFRNFMSYMENCEKAYITDPRITSEDINAILKSWWSSENRKLTGITFGKEDDHVLDGFDMDKILERIPTVPGKMKRREATKHRPNEENYNEGWDFRRKDGVLGTVLPGIDEGILREVTLVVWDDPNPDVSSCE